MAIERFDPDDGYVGATRETLPLADELYGFDDGSFLARTQLPRPADGGGPDAGFLATHYHAVRFARNGREIGEVHRFRPLRRPLLWIRAGGRLVQVPIPEPELAVTPDGDVYASQTDEYRVYAYDREGRMRWALRAPWPRAPITEADVDAAIEDLEAEGFEADGGLRGRIAFPERRPALSRIAVDGRGRLFVFLEPRDRGEAASGDLRVDVYDREGARLFAGWIRDVPWSFVRGDHVYGHRSDPESGEEQVIRHRLEVPFRARPR